MPQALRIAALLALGIPLLSASTTSANGLRCGNRHVDRGDSTVKVQTLCGVPTSRSARTEVRVVRDAIQVACGPQGRMRCARIIENHVTVQIEEWYYDLGPQRLVRNLLFENGILQKIASGEYGTTRD